MSLSKFIFLQLKDTVNPGLRGDHGGSGFMILPSKDWVHFLCTCQTSSSQDFFKEIHVLGNLMVFNNTLI